VATDEGERKNGQSSNGPPCREVTRRKAEIAVGQHRKHQAADKTGFDVLEIGLPAKG